MRHVISIAIATVLFAACTPTNGSPNLIPVHEAEPNDISNDATDVGQSGDYTFLGVCASGEPADWYKVASGAGTIEASLHLSAPPSGGGTDEFAAAPLSFALRNSSSVVLAQEADITSEANLSASLAAETIFVEIGCPSVALSGTANTYYFGTLHVP